jgi:hypothetical protein
VTLGHLTSSVIDRMMLVPAQSPVLQLSSPKRSKQLDILRPHLASANGAIVMMITRLSEARQKLSLNTAVRPFFASSRAAIREAYFLSNPQS